MLLFWLSISILLLGLMYLIYECMGEGESNMGVPIFLFSIVFFIISCLECTPKYNLTDFSKSYCSAIIDIEKYDRDTDSESLAKLYAKCAVVDDMIKENQTYCNSVWRGKAYSKEIAEKELTIPIFNEKFRGN